MTEPPPVGRRSWASGALKAGLLVVGLLAGALGAIVVPRAFDRVAGHSSGSTTSIRSTPDVIVAVRDLARLESAQYHIERVIDLTDRQERLFGLVTARDAILLVAAGDITAGVDLSQLREQDVVVDPRAGTAVLTLPPPQVLMTRLDNERTFVHSRSTDLLARRSPSLETRARQAAEATLRDAAVQGGILDRARHNAEQTLRALLSSLGYAHVDVRWQRD